MGLLSAGATDIGKKRKSNQDSIYLNHEKRLFVVADGMGGHNGGDIASQMATQVISHFVIKNLDQYEPATLQENSVSVSNDAIFAKSQEDKLLEGMGTTVVSMLFKDSTLFLANVGDSRCYLINKHGLYQLSVDHSLIQEKLDQGLYKRHEAARDPHKNILARAVGHDEYLRVDLITYKVCRNDIFMICSDGLHGKVSDEDILKITNAFLPNPAGAGQENLNQTVKALIHQANLNGGNDNISVIMVLAN